MRTIGLRRRDRDLPWDAERVGLATLAAVVLVFGMHSTVDWTWFVPGNALPALICAGWVASRATLRERLAGIRRADAATARSRPCGAAAARSSLIARGRGWSALQPVRACHAQDAALGAPRHRRAAAAASIAQIAHERNPLSVEPLFDLAAIEQAAGRNPEAAERALEQAVDLEPANPETWRRLGYFAAQRLNDPKGALRLPGRVLPRSALAAGRGSTSSRVARLNSAG